MPPPSVAILAFSPEAFLYWSINTFGLCHRALWSDFQSQQAKHPVLFFPKNASRTSVSMEEDRWGAVCPGLFLTVLMIGVSAHLSGQKCARSTFHVIYQCIPVAQAAWYH